jgi:hypothetical protein
VYVGHLIQEVIGTATVPDMHLDALSKRGHRPRSAACVRVGTQLLGCQSRQATWAPWARSSLHLSTNVDDAARFHRPRPK